MNSIGLVCVYQISSLYLHSNQILVCALFTRRYGISVCNIIDQAGLITFGVLVLVDLSVCIIQINGVHSDLLVLYLHLAHIWSINTLMAEYGHLEVSVCLNAHRQPDYTIKWCLDR